MSEGARRYSVLFLCTGNSARSILAEATLNFRGHGNLTVCDSAAGEVCPVWPGVPTTAHWSVRDPAVVQGTRIERMSAFEEAFRILDRRISLLVSLPIASLDRMSLRERVCEIGRS